MSNGKFYVIEKKLESYDKGWREFVSTHEKYLDVIDSENEKEAAYSLYEEQIMRKFEFGCMIKSWRGEVSQRENIDHVSCSKASTSSRASSSSSRLSSSSKRRERLALAQLKFDQIARKPELAKKMFDLQNESEMLEAQMQREEAMMNVSIFERVIQEEREQELGDIEEINENNGQGRLDNAPTSSVQGEERVSLLKVDINDKHSLINQSELVEGGAEFLSSDLPVGLANTTVPKVITHVNSSNPMPEFQGIILGLRGRQLLCQALFFL